MELLAARDDWAPLYDLDRLAANEVPVAAAVYFDDMYVDSGLQLDTAARSATPRPGSPTSTSTTAWARTASSPG